jgi:hypothetical protein
MPNAFAYIVLFGWPVVVYVLFRRLSPTAALGWTVLAGYLLLPTQASLDLPGLPTLNKDAVPALSAGLMLLFGLGAATAGRQQGGKTQPGEDQAALPAPQGQPLVTALLALLLVSPVVTVLANPDPVPTGPGFIPIPGLRLYDAGSVIGGLAVSILPFLLARRWFASPDSHVTLLKLLVLGLLGYSLFILFEVRMSPQLNTWVYGFFPHSFDQHIRAGGFRPVVFLQHGLWLAILLAMAVLAAVALWRQRLAEAARGSQWLFTALYLLLALLLSNSLGALVIALVFLPAVLLLGVRSQLLLAGIVAGTVLLYPAMRSAEMIPVDRVLEIANSISEDRAQSLEFRLANEDALLERAALRPLAGWGVWGRQQIFDFETGLSISVRDSAWIISIGTFGWLGYIASFGLLTLPLLLLAIKPGKPGPSPATAGLALVMAANLVDLLVNATLTPVTWLIGGALVGRLAYRAADGAADGAAARRSWGLVTDRKPILADTATPPPPVRGRAARRMTDGT